MNKKKGLTILIVISCWIGCVQKSSRKWVEIDLQVGGIKNIQTVGIRGSDKPLDWEYDLELKPIIKDSLYRATISFITGYTFVETKFTINGHYEPHLKANRKIVFNHKDTIKYGAIFDPDNLNN